MTQSRPNADARLYGVHSLAARCGYAGGWAEQATETKEQCYTCDSDARPRMRCQWAFGV